MTLSENLSEAAHYTGSLFQRLGELLILFIISIIPIVNFIAIGYYAKTIRDNQASKSSPKLEKYTDLFVDGLKIFVVTIIWAIIILIISIIIAIPFIAVAFLGALFSNPLGWIFVLGPFMVIFGVIAFLLGIFAFMGIVHMVKQNSFGKAFAFGEIFSTIGKIGWLRYLAYFVVAFVVAAIIGAVSGLIFGIGWVIGAFLQVLAGIFFARTIGLMYDQATAPPAVPTPPPTETPPSAPTGTV